jgi:hypothetical protein
MKSKLESDPFIRFCTKANCEGYMRAESKNAKRLTCDLCNTSVCFRCREDWHGYFTSCNKVIIF